MYTISLELLDSISGGTGGKNNSSSSGSSTPPSNGGGDDWRKQWGRIGFGW